MQDTTHPEVLGVFSPVGHVVASFPTQQDMEGAAAELGQQGFATDKIVRFSPAEMKAQAELDLDRASPLAELGYEVKLVRAHRELAEKGYSFLMVHAPKGEQTQLVAEVASRFHAERAQKYGNFAIEELITPVAEEDHVVGTPAKGRA
ncbi:MAG: hypothetical protein H7Z15_03090 [Rhizobacter sp.]|nr:hypothetical protein [Rhizobacter sp.]